MTDITISVPRFRIRHHKAGKTTQQATGHHMSQRRRVTFYAEDELFDLLKRHAINSNSSLGGFVRRYLHSRLSMKLNRMSRARQ